MYCGQYLFRAVIHLYIYTTYLFGGGLRCSRAVLALVNLPVTARSQKNIRPSSSFYILQQQQQHAHRHTASLKRKRKKERKKERKKRRKEKKHNITASKKQTGEDKSDTSLLQITLFQGFCVLSNWLRLANVNPILSSLFHLIYFHRANISGLCGAVELLGCEFAVRFVDIDGKRCGSEQETGATWNANTPASFQRIGAVEKFGNATLMNSMRKCSARLITISAHDGLSLFNTNQFQWQNMSEKLQRVESGPSFV